MQPRFFATVIPMKWLGVILLVIVGILAALVAVEYLTVSIHAVPSFMGRHPGRGHYRKRGAVAALIALIAFVAAGYLFFRIRGADKPAVATAGSGPLLAADPAQGAEELPTATPEQPAAELPTESAAAAEQPAESSAAPEQPAGE